MYKFCIKCCNQDKLEIIVFGSVVADDGLRATEPHRKRWSISFNEPNLYVCKRNANEYELSRFPTRFRPIRSLQFSYLVFCFVLLAKSHSNSNEAKDEKN